ncbi:hypothetical protein SAMN05444275_1313, partial [Myroides odoratimimus subsp. xuanwuensis]
IIDLNDFVKSNETVTTLLAGADGTYTYKSEDGTETVIDIPASVANNFETIVNNNPEKVKEIIEKVAKDVEGNVIYNGKDLVYKDKDGNDQIIDLNDFVKSNETVTTLVAGADGTYTYKSEDGTETKIDIPASVANNFETIVNNNPEKVKEIIEKVAKDVEGNVIYNGKDLVYKDKDGNDQTIDLDKLVKANETVTKLIDNKDGTFTYFNEKAIDSDGNVIDEQGVSFKLNDGYALVDMAEYTSTAASDRSYTYNQIVGQNIQNEGEWRYIPQSSVSFNNPVYTLNFKSDVNKTEKRYIQLSSIVKTNFETINDFTVRQHSTVKIVVSTYLNSQLIASYNDYLILPIGGGDPILSKYSKSINIDHLMLLETNNNLEIRVAVESSTFKKNGGDQDGNFAKGDVKLLTFSVKDISFQLFQK